MTNRTNATDHQRRRGQFDLTVTQLLPLKKRDGISLLVESKPGGPTVNGGELTVLFLNQNLVDHGRPIATDCCIRTRRFVLLFHTAPDYPTHRRVVRLLSAGSVD